MVLAAAGVVLLSPGVGQSVETLGLVLALIAGAFWAAYVLTSEKAGRAFEGGHGLALAMMIGAVVMLAPGVAAGGTALLRPEVLAVGIVVALLSTALPYSLELEALRRVPSGTYGVLLSMQPATAVVVGFIGLNQDLTATELAAVGLIVVASAGALKNARAPARPAAIHGEGRPRKAGGSDQPGQRRSSAINLPGVSDACRITLSRRSGAERLGSLRSDASYVEDYPAGQAALLEHLERTVRLGEGQHLVDDQTHMAVGDQLDRSRELAAGDVAGADQLKLAQREKRGGNREVGSRLVADSDDPTCRPNQAHRAGEGRLSTDVVDHQVKRTGLRTRHGKLFDLRIIGPQGVKTQLRGYFQRSIRVVKANCPCACMAGDLKRVDPHPSQPDHDDVHPGAYLTAADNRAKRRPKRAGQWSGVQRINVLGNREEAIQRHHDLLGEPARVSEAGPGDEIRALVLFAGATASAAPTRGVVVDDDIGTRLNGPGGVGGKHSPGDLMTRNVRKRKLIAERHQASRRLYIAEADATGKHLEQRVPRGQLRFGEVELDQRLLVGGNGHRPHRPHPAADCPTRVPVLPRRLRPRPCTALSRP